MIKRILITALCVLAVFAVTLSCKHKPYLGTGNGNGNGNFEKGCYPDAVAEIIVKRCATAGCHNQASYTGAGGLRLDKWEELFKGGANGSAVIPFNPEYSPLLYFINTDSTLGVVSAPTMPADGSGPLTKTEYLTISDWIKNGAPDCNGKVPFSDNADTRQKIYMTQQGCDLVAVIDAESKLVMRYIKVGALDGFTESPHCIRVSPDTKNAYVCFTGGTVVQRINTATDEVEATMNIPGSGTTQWNILYVTPDNKNILISDLIGGRVNMMNASSGAMVKQYSPMLNPHGITTSANYDTIFISAQYGNAIYRMGYNVVNSDFAQKISLDANPAAPQSGSTTGKPDPHEILMLPDRSKYIVTCQGTNEVKVVDAHTNAVLKTFTTADGVGIYPQEIALSEENRYAYISCQDKFGTGIYKGSIFVFNYETLTVLPGINAMDGQFSQPHGLTVDDRNDILYVASINADGPAPHHVTACGGRSGYYRIFSSKYPFTQINGRKYEVSVAPYSVDVRFKN
jgi:DNA-binding beta-propeller fold protein YncE